MYKNSKEFLCAPCFTAFSLIHISYTGIHFFRYEDDGGIDSESCPTGMLTVVLLEARGLPKADIFSNSDPFCVLSLSPTFSEESQKSKSKIDTNDPVWNESFEFFVEDFSAQELKLDFFDKGFLTRRLGSQTLRLADLTPSHPQQVTCHLTEQGKTAS